MSAGSGGRWKLCEAFRLPVLQPGRPVSENGHRALSPVGNDSGGSGPVWYQSGGFSQRHCAHWVPWAVPASEPSLRVHDSLVSRIKMQCHIPGPRGALRLENLSAGPREPRATLAPGGCQTQGVTEGLGAGALLRPWLSPYDLVGWLDPVFQEIFQASLVTWHAASGLGGVPGGLAAWERGPGVPWRARLARSLWVQVDGQDRAFL